MSVKSVLVILISLSVTNASEDSAFNYINTEHFDIIIQTLDALENNTYKQLNNIESKVDKILHDTEASGKEANEKLEKNIIEKLEKYIDGKFELLEYHIIQNINMQLDNASKRAEKHFEESINFRLDAMETRSINSKEKTNCECCSTNNSLFHDSDVNGMQEKTLGYWDCKNLTVRTYDYDPISLKNKTLNYIKHTNDEDGLSYLEMQLAMKGDVGLVQVSSVNGADFENTYFVIGGGSGAILRQIAMYNSPNLISTSKFTAFTFKINNGTLEFGKTGSAPVVNFTDDRLKTVKYFGFTSWYNHVIEILYDCPPHFEETLK